MSLNSDSLAKKNRKKEETPCLSCKKKEETAKTETIQRKTWFFEKKGEYVKRRKEKRQRKVNQIQENLPKKRYIQKGQLKKRSKGKTDIQEREKMRMSKNTGEKHTPFF